MIGLNEFLIHGLDSPLVIWGSATLIYIILLCLLIAVRRKIKHKSVKNKYFQHFKSQDNGKN